MMKLINMSRGQTVLENLEVADTFWTRAIGLLGRSRLEGNSGLWIQGSGSIHTFFMRFAIDLVFLDENLVVTKIVEKVQPWRMVWRGWKSASVIELQSGFVEKCPLSIGEQLHVDHSLS
jgi:uncharacterized membrane protein (UPF0127 family)